MRLLHILSAIGYTALLVVVLLVCLPFAAWVAFTEPDAQELEDMEWE